MSLISDHIERMILDLLDAHDGTAKFKRGTMAEHLNCVPSQITYVLKTRFNPNQGYRTESRRGEGGYIIVQRLVDDGSQSLKHFVFNLDDELGQNEARILIKNLDNANALSGEATTLLNAVNASLANSGLDGTAANELRAHILRDMLMALLTD